MLAWEGCQVLDVTGPAEVFSVAAALTGGDAYDVRIASLDGDDVVSTSGVNSGLGFAAPSNIVKTVFDQIRQFGRVRRGEIGVRAQTVTPVLAAGLGLSRDWGAVLADVMPGGPANRAGLAVGDLVVSVDGKPIENGRQLNVTLYRKAVGDVVRLEVLRDEQVKSRADDSLPRLACLFVAPSRVVAPLDSRCHSIHPRCIENSVAVSEAVMGTETEAFLAEILPKQRAAEEAIHNGDPEPRLALWTRDDPVTVFGAGLNGFGWAEVEPLFKTVASWFSDSEAYEFEVIAAGASGDLAYTVGYERNRVKVEGTPTTYTHVYRREDGEWRIVHRHGDSPPDGVAPFVARDATK